jgi:DhnA family fructose-bisphosphate aldolase class Ia
MDSKSYRLCEFINQADKRSLVLDTSGGLALGALPGLECFSTALEPLLPLIDGLVASPGQAPRLIESTRRSGLVVPLLVRADWTNAIRPQDFVLPPETIHRVLLLDPSQGLELGASALVLHFLLGHEETIEAGCLRDAVQLAIQGSQVGIPLIIDVQPLGPRIVLRSQAIALGVSYAIEAGADGVVVPWPGQETLRIILGMAAGSPVWIKPSGAQENHNLLADALSLGATGVWLDERALYSAPFSVLDTAGTVQALRAVVHQEIPQPLPVGQSAGV